MAPDPAHSKDVYSAFCCPQNTEPALLFVRGPRGKKIFVSIHGWGTLLSSSYSSGYVPRRWTSPAPKRKAFDVSIPVLVTEFSTFVFAEFDRVKKKKKNWAVSQEKELCKYV